MNIQLVRHATLWVEYAGLRLLVDPMFSDAKANPPIVNSANLHRNPLVALPSDRQQWLEPDAVLVTHLHQDHWDKAASSSLLKSVPIFCQPGDERNFMEDGFTSVTAVDQSLTFQCITISRTDGQHGTGLIGQKMGKVSGFVLQSDAEPTVYVAGDTIWCEEVKAALDAYHPDVTVVNAGGARFLIGEPITMDEEDVIHVCRYAPYTKVIAVHMDAINHCLVTRSDLRQGLQQAGLSEQVLIPEDGEWVETANPR
ncbi:MBL fold metallo-hydrolase [Paenibacillus hexagrammi]|uniref:MBL fold metallo-hydrolase n=1 Tax=Paenibacillus hexagrammi TaxID=2908839 RepID=A0ABY3SKJ4_9BACL|nr:MBL fold metallo-hydrolase [Paenibacillus sp. YPD9-1]UJF34040.1 MBL fold metallo-hydrolase [Paenibacillus sp. YPD9-1]